MVKFLRPLRDSLTTRKQDNMQKLSILATTLLATAAPTIAQGCSGPAPNQLFSNREEFAVNYYYQLGSMLFDIDAQVDLSINSFSTWSYDQGAGNPVVPNQVGGTGPVQFYAVPTTFLGSETLDPAVPGSPWLNLGTGLITIAAYPGAESQIVFSTPVTLPAGQWGVALVFEPTTTGPNPGLVQHCLAIAAAATPSSDDFVTMSNQVIQGTAWTGNGGGNPNLRMNYDVPATAAHNQILGEGCYFRPQAFYQDFPASLTAADIANTSQLWIYNPPAAPNGANYLIVPSGTSFAASPSPSLTLTAPVSTSSANWDDALSPPITLPFTFPFPGGSTSDITIGSNGCIYLASVVDSTYAVCGAAYGSIAGFRDLAPRLAPFYVDLDPSAAGTIHYDVAAGNGSVTITWDSVPEWPAGPNTNTIQVILNANGDVEIVYGNLSNEAVANSNNAIYGFTPGNGSPLPAQIDISTEILAGYMSGNNAILPILTPDSRAVLGSTPNVVTSNLTAGTQFGALVVGTQAVTPALDLGGFGMPGCFLHCNFFVVFTQVLDPVTGTFNQPLPIPSNPALTNQTIVMQSAPLTPGFNALGLLISNGLCLRIGD